MTDKKYVVLWNNGAFFKGSKNVFTKSEIQNIVFKDVTEFVIGEELYDNEDDDVHEFVDFDNVFVALTDAGECGEKVQLCNIELVEMGDDFVEVSIIELTDS